MAWSYDPLWKQLIDKNLKKTDLLTIAKISTNTLANMGKKETVSMAALGKLCQALHCRIEDILEYIPEERHDDQ